MKKLVLLLGVVTSLGLFLGPRVSAAVAEAKGDELPEIQGILGTKEGFAVFATIAGGKAHSLTGLGQTLGPYELVAVDVVQSFADFRKPGRAAVRIYMREGTALPSAGTGENPNDIEIPRLSAFTKFIIADQLRGDPTTEQKIRSIINRAVNNPRLTLEERREVLNRYLSGEVVMTVDAPFEVRIYPRGSPAIPVKSGP